MLVGSAYHEVISADNLKFIGNAVKTSGVDVGGNDNSYNSGFVTLADAATGLRVTATGHGNNEYFMNSKFFNSKQIWYRYTSGSGPHGRIETTSEGNWGGKLNDGGTILDGGDNPHAEDASGNEKSNSYVIAEGKTVTYTMTPDTGYKIKKLRINGEYVQYHIGDNLYHVSAMKKGDSMTVTTKAGKEGKLKYEEDGTYTFIFPYALHDEEIFVEWEPTTADLLVFKRWHDEDDKDGLREAAEMPKIRLEQSLDNGRTWTAVEGKNPQDVPDGKDDATSKYLDGVYDMDNDGKGLPPKRNHPYTWEYLPVYRYDSNGNYTRPILYRITEEPDPAITGYKYARYFDDQSFDLTSEKSKSIDGWLIYEDSSHNEYVLKGDGKYYTVTGGEVAPTPAQTQPDPGSLRLVTSSDYRTVDHALPYKSVEVKNEHTTTDLYVGLNKKWEDDYLWTAVPKSGTNQYDREKLQFVLSGKAGNEDVDLVPDDDDKTDLILEISSGKTGQESHTEAEATGKIDRFQLYKASDNKSYAHVLDKAGYEDGYYGLKSDGKSIDYGTGPVSGLTGLTKVEKGDGTYKIDNYNFGALFDGLPTHYKGIAIEYKLVEKDSQGNVLDGWTTTGGDLVPVKNSRNELVGYETGFVNTPVSDDKVSPLPLTIEKKDAVTDTALEGGQFTVYTDAVSKKKASENDTEKIDGKTVYTDGNKRYVLKGEGEEEKYYEVDSEDKISATPANPQPDKDSLRESKIPGTGEVDDNEVTTNALGQTTIRFTKAGTYYVVETKAPKGYTADSEIYTFIVDEKLQSITFEERDKHHETKWWQRLIDLLFLRGTPKQDNWVPASDDKGGTLTVKDEPIRASVLVRKVWNDENDRDGIRPEDGEDSMPVVTLQKTTKNNPAEEDWEDVNIPDPDREGQTIPASEKVTHNGGPVHIHGSAHQHDAYTWSNLPAYEYGKIITYRIKETGSIIAGNNAHTAYIIESNKTTQTDEEQFHLAREEAGTDPTPLNQTVEVKNKHIPETINIQAFKKWDDEDTTKRKETTLTLYKIVNGATSVVTKVDGEPDTGTVPVTDKPDPVKIWNDLPAYENGYPVTYRIVEAGISGYSTSYEIDYTKTDGSSVNTEGDRIDSSDVLRTYYGEEHPEGKKAGDESTTASFRIFNSELTDVTVKKTWVSGANANITFTLWRKTGTVSPVSETQVSAPAYYVKREGGSLITAAEYNELSAEKKALYKAEAATSWDTNGWKQVGEHLFIASGFDSTETFSTQEYTFKNLPLKDDNGKKYTYRVSESPQLRRYTENQISDTEIVDHNVNSGSAYATIEVAKELTGRKWLDTDQFMFQIEAVGGNKYKTSGNPVPVDPENVPMPERIYPGQTDPTTLDTAIADKDAVLGTYSRAVPFSNIEYKRALFDSDTERIEYIYKVYEIAGLDKQGNKITLDDYTNHTGKKDGITYAGVVEEHTVWPDKFIPEEHFVKVTVSRSGSGEITTDIKWKNDSSGKYVSGWNPVYKNEYTSSGTAKIWIEKNIRNRKWKNFNGTSGDAFQFEISGVSGAQINMTGEGEDSYITNPATGNDGVLPDYKYIEDKQELSDTEYAFGIAGNPYTGDMLNEDGWANFIYAIDELGKVTYKGSAGATVTGYTVDGLDYDPNTIYARLRARDNFDGTISFNVRYFRDAACRNEITDHQVWVKYYGSTDAEKRLLTKKESAEADKMTDEQLKDHHYRKVNVAYFTNSEKKDIPVTKEWIGGPAIEDVNLHLERHLFTLDEDSSNLTASYVNDAEKNWEGSGPFWETVGRTHISGRGEFLDEDGTPRYDDPDTKTSSVTYKRSDDEEKNKSIKDFNLDVPMYVVRDGVTYRAVYRLFEDNTSDAYETTYGNRIFINDDDSPLVVKNTVKATNTAGIAAVKQLLGRPWKAGDSFDFVLKPTGIGIYNDDGSFNSIDSSPKGKAKVPMPKDGDTDNDKATATSLTQTVDPNGNLERLAKFGEIQYTVNDLVYDKTDKHMQGDFFYTMEEVVPPGADDNVYRGVKYDTDKHTVHVKVRENRTGKLQVQIAYDYDKDKPADITTGTPFTPVFTNKYDAAENVGVDINKYLRGREWSDDGKYVFIMTPIGGAPFNDANKNDFPPEAKDTGTKQDIIAAFNAGKAAHTARGAHIIRLNVDTNKQIQEAAFPKIRFVYSDLNKTIGEGEVIPDKDGKPLSEGAVYGRFMYAFTETADYGDIPEDINIDKDTEYVRITVYDKGDGTLEHYIEVFEDRYATVPRYVPDPKTGEPTDVKATKPVFVNQWKRDLSATKAWAGHSTEDVTLRLQWSVNGRNYFYADGTEWLGHVAGTRIIKKNASGDDLTVTWEDLPAYANVDEDGNPDDDKDLTDRWVYYQVVEDKPSGAEVRYSLNPYEEDDKITDKKYSKEPIHTGPEKVDGKYPDPKNRINHLYVTNFPKNITGNAKISVVKQYIGKDWDNESFTFEITPVKSRIGNETEYKSASERSMPAFDGAHGNRAVATKNTSKVSVNERAASFDPLTVNRSDLKLDPSKGAATGEFIYKISEIIPQGAVETSDGCYVMEDAAGNKIKYTADEHTVKVIASDDGSGIDITVSYDNRESGEYVPVFTNFAMKTTPVYGTKEWVGGPDAEHDNGTVELNDNNTEIISSTDKLGLKLQRKPDKKNAEPKDVINDDAGRPLEIVWVEETRTTKEVETGNYVNKNDSTDVISAEEYNAMTPEERANYKKETVIVTTISYEKQEGKDDKGTYTYTVKAKDSNKYVDPVLNTSDDDGNKYIYSVVEGNVPAGYDVSYNGMDVTNTSASGSTKVVVSKKWDDADDQDGKRPESVEVSIKAEGWDGKDLHNKQVGNITLDDSNNWKSVFKDLPEKNKAGKKYDYTISEDTASLPKGYDATVRYQSLGDKNWSTTKPEDWNGKVLVTNSYTPGKLNIKATKVWEGETDEVGTSLRSDVILHLYGKDDSNGLVVYDAGTKKISKDASEDERTVTWKDIPKRHYKNEDLSWEVTEEPVFGYTTKITGDFTEGFVVTNTYSEPVTKVTAKKVWDDDNVWEDKAYTKRPEKVTFELWRKVGDSDPEQVSGSDKTVSKDTTKPWTAEWNNLPVVKKVELESETEKERTEYKTVKKQKTDVEGNLIFKKLDTGEEVTVSKEDAEAENSEYQDPENYKPVMIEEEVPVKETEKAKETKEVPVFYMVKEAKIDDPHYADPVYTVTEPGKFRVINSFIKETINIPVKKIWIDNGDTSGLRPDHITLNLIDRTHNDKIVRQAELSSEDKTSEDIWEHTFMGVPKYDENGAEIVYEVTEKKVPAYETEVVKDGEGGYIITNTHNVGAKTSLTVTKKWEGDEADKSDRTSVQVQLIEVVEGAKKEVGDPVTLEFDKSDPDKPMSYTWYNLDTIYHGKSGAEHIVTYTVTEKPVKGYTSNVSDTKERYDEVTPEKGDNPKAKGWYVKVGDEYKAATDTSVEKGKTYYEKHFTVTVTNTLGEIPLRGDVIYVDPKNPVGKNAMIVKSTSYRKPEEAKDAAEKRTDAPSDPKHKGVNFVGWDLNWDENGNYVLVAIYSDIPTTVTPVTTYIDPQSGEPVLISEITNDPSSVKVPADPKHNDLQFVGWVKSVDAGGNTIFVAKFKADCANNANATGNGKGINTGEGNELILWVSTMFAAGALLSIHLEMRRRQRSR